MHHPMSLAIALSVLASGALCSPSAQHLTLNRRSTLPVSNATSPLAAALFGSTFDVNVTFGNQTFPLLVDTGSSDTYVIGKGFKCFDKLNGTELPEVACLYGNATYTPTDTYSEIADEMLGIQWGAGIASGVVAHEDVTVGGITVKGAKIGVANASSPLGDGVNSGLLGLAYPALTSAHPANTTDNTTYFYNRLTYDPVLFTMHKQGLIDGYFSLTLARNPQNATSGFGGYLSLGGIPPVPHNSNFTTVPVEIDNSVPIQITSNERVRAYWATTISGIVYGPGAGSPSTTPSSPQPNNITTPQTVTNSTPFQAFFDNGNFFSYLPLETATQINSLFSPPALFDNATGLWIVNCAAAAPQLGFEVGGQTFFLDGRDLLYQTGVGDSAVCVSSIMSSSFQGGSYGDVTLNIIGASFFKSVLCVFDFAEHVMRFAQLEGEVTEEQGQGGGVNGSGNSTVEPSSGAMSLEVGNLWVIITVLGSAAMLGTSVL